MSLKKPFRVACFRQVLKEIHGLLLAGSKPRLNRESFQSVICSNHRRPTQLPIDPRQSTEPMVVGVAAFSGGLRGLSWFRQMGVVASRESAGMVPNPAHQRIALQGANANASHWAAKGFCSILMSRSRKYARL